MLIYWLAALFDFRFLPTIREQSVAFVLSAGPRCYYFHTTRTFANFTHGFLTHFSFIVAS